MVFHQHTEDPSHFDATEAMFIVVLSWSGYYSRERIPPKFSFQKDQEHHITQHWSLLVTLTQINREFVLMYFNIKRIF